MSADQDQGIPEPSEQRDISIPQYHPIRTDEESHFLTYLTALSLIFVVAYFVYQHKQKVNKYFFSHLYYKTSIIHFYP